MIKRGSNMGVFLRWGNWLLGKMIGSLYNGPGLTDVGCTYRLIRRGALRKIQKDFTTGDSRFSPDMIISAIKNGISIIEIPVSYGKRIGTSTITGNKWRAFTLGLKMIKLIICRRFGR
jgi:hypothetical protein